MKYGYARVSTTDQDASLQIDALQEHGCDEIFVDKISGSTVERPELTEMCNQLHSGDVVVGLEAGPDALMAATVTIHHRDHPPRLADSALVAKTFLRAARSSIADIQGE